MGKDDGTSTGNWVLRWFRRRLLRQFFFNWVSMDKQMATIYYSVQDLRFRIEMGRGSSALRPSDLEFLRFGAQVSGVMEKQTEQKIGMIWNYFEIQGLELKM